MERNMHLGDIVIDTGLCLAPLAGIVGSMYLTQRNVSVIRRILWIAILAFTCNILAGIWVAHSGKELTVVRLFIFYTMVCFELYAIFSLGCSVGLLFRKELRNQGLRLLLISLSPVPISLIIVFFGKMLLKHS
jgi:hypothetical protein